MRIAVVSACSAGIASTYMAAEALELAARKRGHWIRVETQGTMGIENEITASEARSVDVVIFATDIKIRNRERFQGKPIIEVGVAEAIRHADAIIQRVENAVKS